jgi:hypothetical protein
VTFKHPPHTIFPQVEAQKGNALIIRLQPNEGITMRVTIKDPGPGGMRLVEVPLDMTFASALGPEAGKMPEAYERLIMDVVRGNQTLFMRGDEVEAAWAWVDPIIAPGATRARSPTPTTPARRADRGLQAHLVRRPSLAGDRGVIEVAQHTYPDRDTMMRSLAELVADQLRGALASKHRATLAVPGGTTPVPSSRGWPRRTCTGRPSPCS